MGYRLAITAVLAVSLTLQACTATTARVSPLASPPESTGIIQQGPPAPAENVAPESAPRTWEWHREAVKPLLITVVALAIIWTVGGKGPGKSQAGSSGGAGDPCAVWPPDRPIYCAPGP